MHNSKLYIIVLLKSKHLWVCVNSTWSGIPANANIQTMKIFRKLMDCSNISEHSLIPDSSKLWRYWTVQAIHVAGVCAAMHPWLITSLKGRAWTWCKLKVLEFEFMSYLQLTNIQIVGSFFGLIRPPLNHIIRLQYWASDDCQSFRSRLETLSLRVRVSVARAESWPIPLQCRPI